MKNFDFTKMRSKAAVLLVLFLLPVILFSLSACGSKPTENESENSSDDSAFYQEGTYFPAESASDDNSYQQSESASNTQGSEDSTSSSSDTKPSNNTPTEPNNSGSNSKPENPTNPNSGNNGGNGGNSNNKPQNPTNPTNPVKPTEPTAPEVPVIKDSITRLPEAEKLAWAEINRRRVAGGVSAFNHCDSCEATANKQAKFNAEYIIWEEMSMHATSECGTVTWYASGKESNNDIAMHLVNNWWNSAGHKANFMDDSRKNGGIAIYRVVRDGVVGYMSIFHFCGDSEIDGKPYCPAYFEDFSDYPEFFYKRK